ncbi:MAG TPA: flagellar basal body rod C-terminal domain-containing protein [Caulobacteraceae bacterium]|jgi:flagellar basal-body rod protein FlgC
MTPAAAIAASGLAAATLRVSVSAANLANADDTAAVGSEGYQAQGVAQSAVAGGGVVARAVTLKPGSVLTYDPTSPVAGVSGMVETPEIDPIAEVTNQLQASRAFAFSLEALQSAEQEQQSLLDVTS